MYACIYLCLYVLKAAEVLVKSCPGVIQSSFKLFLQQLLAVTLHKLLTLSVSQFPNLENETNNRIYFRALLERLDALAHIKDLEQCLEHRKYLIKPRNYYGCG